MSYQPKLFIGIGETGAFFTLRETHQVYIPGPGDMGNAVVNGVYQGTIRIESHHHFNLSQDINEAIEKAKAAADRMGLPLVPPSAEKMAQEMREIVRAGADELAERARRDAEMQAMYAAQRAKWEAQREMEQADLLKAGRFPWGKQMGERFEDAEIGYLNWVMDKRDEFEPGSHMRQLADAVWLNCAHLKLPSPDPAAELGKPGQRIEIEATAIRQHSFPTEWGMKYITTLVATGGECVVVFSTSWALDVGLTARFKATVKEHKEYNGQMQTIVQRVKVVEAKAA